MRVETYNLKASNGNHIRKATKVIMDDGEVIEFMEKMSNKEARRQAFIRKLDHLTFEFIARKALKNYVK